MCVLPKAPKVPVLPERQQVQVPEQPADAPRSLNARRKRGFYASIMTSAQGAQGSPSVTGVPGTMG